MFTPGQNMRIYFQFLYVLVMIVLVLGWNSQLWGVLSTIPHQQFRSSWNFPEWFVVDFTFVLISHHVLFFLISNKKNRTKTFETFYMLNQILLKKLTGLLLKTTDKITIDILLNLWNLHRVLPWLTQLIRFLIQDSWVPTSHQPRELCLNFK